MKLLLFIVYFVFNSIYAYTGYRVGDFLKYAYYKNGKLVYIMEKEIIEFNDFYDDYLFQYRRYYPNRERPYISEEWVEEFILDIRTITYEKCLYKDGVTYTKFVLGKELEVCSLNVSDNNQIIVSEKIPFYFLEYTNERDGTDSIKREILSFHFGTIF